MADFLKKHWPDTRQYDDIKELTYDKLRSDGIDKIDIITGGYPCQPFCNCARAVDTSERHERVWRDIEKCIFVDKFMQFPKNFAKIASYLKHRNTQDCIKFYYDSKPNISYKALLKEAENRRRKVRNSWIQASDSAQCVGGIIYPPSSEV